MVVDRAVAAQRTASRTGTARPAHENVWERRRSHRRSARAVRLQRTAQFKRDFASRADPAPRREAVVRFIQNPCHASLPLSGWRASEISGKVELREVTALPSRSGKIPAF